MLPALRRLLQLSYCEHAFKFRVRLCLPEARATLGIRSWVASAAEGAHSAGRAGALLRARAAKNSIFRPESKQDYPPNLSILISGGKENNCDALSNGE